MHKKINYSFTLFDNHLLLIKYSYLSGPPRLLPVPGLVLQGEVQPCLQPWQQHPQHPRGRRWNPSAHLPASWCPPHERFSEPGCFSVTHWTSGVCTLIFWASGSRLVFLHTKKQPFFSTLLFLFTMCKIKSTDPATLLHSLNWVKIIICSFFLLQVCKCDLSQNPAYVMEIVIFPKLSVF